MKHNKKNIIRVLQAENENTMEIYHYYENNGEHEKALKYLHESMAIEHVILMLKDKKDMEKYAEIFGIKEEE